ncbi:MAG: helix-turn-helix domain-containing protein [Bacteroidales bacterium]|jgi:transcriptional regulator with XRE-family HTH domain|nr:helix-turn-helix domain-containing protein [Bacteroidales bacterium]
MIDRIKQVMTSKSLTSGQFSEILEMNRSNLTHIFTGRHQPSLDIIRKMLLVFPDINPDWLINGTGNMLRSSTPTHGVTSDEKTTSPPTPLKKIVELNLFAEETHLEEKEVTLFPQIETESATELEETQLIEKPIKRIENNASEKNIPAPISEAKPIFNSQEVKKVEKIVFFFDNQTFEVYFPQK